MKKNACPHCEGKGFNVYPPNWDRYNLRLPYDTVLPCLHCDATGILNPPEAAEAPPAASPAQEAA